MRTSDDGLTIQVTPDSKPPNLKFAMPAAPVATPSRHAVAWLVHAGLNAHRQGGVPELPARARRLRACLEQPWLATVWGTLGDRLQPERRGVDSRHLLLAWALSQLRPDHQATLEGIDDAAWVHSTAWRPVLALAAQNGFLAVPDFPTIYRRRAGEPVADTLCGLWSVGPSTLYRYLEKGRRLMVDLLGGGPADGALLLSLRRYVDLAGPDAPPAAARPAWHRQRAQDALLRDAAADALWHHTQAQDVTGCAGTLNRFALELAESPETQLLLEALKHQDRPARERFELVLAEAPLWRFRRDDAREQACLQQALRLAQESGEALLLGRATAALAFFDHARDPDRAISRYEASIEHCQAAVTAARGDALTEALGEVATGMTRLAWLHLRRSDPKAKPLLAAVARMRDEGSLPAAATALLELVLSEQWRCENELPRAIEHQQRALLIFEQLGQRRDVLNGYNNLCLLYAQQAEFGKAQDHAQRVLDAARRHAVEPNLEASAHGNLAVACMNVGDFDAAIAHLHQALPIYLRLDMQRHVVTCHLNLAESHYQRFQLGGDPADERRGDDHAAQGQALSKTLELPSLTQAAAGLKRQILTGLQDGERLLPPEQASHPDEMNEVQRLRNELALPRPAAQRARTHLALARQYLLIASKEREAARSLIARHGVSDDLGPEFDQLQQAWGRELSREQQLSSLWRERLGALVGDAPRRAVVARLLAQGSLNKSAYAEAAQVSPATASKHLGLLAGAGLLVQRGKGPSTRYTLPQT